MKISFPFISGMIGSKTFTDILLDLITLNLGSNYFPNTWMHFTQPDVSFHLVWISEFALRIPIFINKSVVLKMTSTCTVLDKRCQRSKNETLSRCRVDWLSLKEQKSELILLMNIQSFPFT